jgi:ribonuclease BN (tRNA processing enzyme)
MPTKFIGCDLAKVYESADGRKVLRTLYWGDAVEVTGKSGARTRIKFRHHESGKPDRDVTAYLGKDIVLGDERPLAIRFVDVGQGDGAIVETPKGKLMLIDGGEGEHLQRYVRTAFKERPLPIDTILVSHGDADHFSGLTKLLDGQFKVDVRVERVFHNGLAKRPSTKNGKKRPDVEMFGATAAKQGALFVTELVDDVGTVADASLNEPFKAWKKALGALRNAKNKKPAVARLEAGSPLTMFADEGVTFDVLGPITEKVGGAPALRMLHDSPGSASYSASHTVNGHSVVVRLNYGNVRVLFAADLNEESEDLLLSAQADLEAEVLKVPHHGSADFSVRMLSAVAPLVSVVSAGDEDPSKDYIHPRALLIGALGHASRVSAPVILVTEMVAFIENLDKADLDLAKNAGIGDWFRLTRKTQFGIVHVRTDGRRLLVVTRGALADKLEAYAYTVDAAHAIKEASVTSA